MSTVAVNPPKTPVTKGSMGIAAATLPNICKMPGPPAPFIPTPLPNIGTSDDSPQGYSTTVKIESQPVAITGASFNSKGDIPSQGTGGGLVSNNVQGATKFVAPGSLDVKIEGKSTQYLGDQMTNNNGPGGSPPNAATMMGVAQAPGPTPMTKEEKCAKHAQDIDDAINRDDRNPDGTHAGIYGLKHRFGEQIGGAHPPGTTGTHGWENHDEKIREGLEYLNRKLRAYDQDGCKNDLVPGARAWAERTPPSADDWIGRDVL